MIAVKLVTLSIQPKTLHYVLVTKKKTTRRCGCGCGWVQARATVYMPKENCCDERGNYQPKNSSVSEVDHTLQIDKTMKKKKSGRERCGRQRSSRFAFRPKEIERM